MADFIRIAVSRLLQSGYDLYIPLQRPLFDELVILDKGQFFRCIVRQASLCAQRGPTLNTKFIIEHSVTLLSDLSIDKIIAVLVCRQQIWMIPIDAIGEKTTIRLQSRSDWLIDRVMNVQFDASTRDQRSSERNLVVEAEEERMFYERILAGGQVACDS